MHRINFNPFAAQTPSIRWCFFYFWWKSSPARERRWSSMWFLMSFFSRSTVCVLWNSLAIRWVSGSCFPGLARRCAIRCSFRVLFAWVGGDCWVLGFGASLTIDLQNGSRKVFALFISAFNSQVKRGGSPATRTLIGRCCVPCVAICLSWLLLLHAIY